MTVLGLSKHLEAESNLRPPQGHEQRSRTADRIHVGFALSVLTGVHVVASFGTQWYIVSTLGAGADTDALFSGLTITQLLTSVAIYSLTVVILPLLSVKSEVERKRAGWPLFLSVGSLSAVIVLILFLVAPVLVPFTVPGFSQAATQLTIVLTKIQLVGLVGAACYAVLAALYQARNCFLWALASMLLCQLVGWLLLILKLQEGGVMWAAWVQVFILCGPAVLLLPVLGDWRRPCWSDQREFFRITLRRMRPLMVSAAYYRTGFVVDRFLASFLAPGSVVILDLVWRVHVAIVRVLDQGLVMPVVPQLSRLAETKDWEKFRGLYRQRLTWAIALGAVVLGGMIVGALAVLEVIPLVGSDHPTGNFTLDDLKTIGIVLLCSSGVVLCGSSNYLSSSTYYAMGDTSTPTKIEMGAYTIGLLMKVLGFFLGGIIGIALAMSLSYILNGILLQRFLRRHILEKAKQSL